MYWPAYYWTSNLPNLSYLSTTTRQSILLTLSLSQNLDYNTIRYVSLKGIAVLNLRNRCARCYRRLSCQNEGFISKGMIIICIYVSICKFWRSSRLLKLWMGRLSYYLIFSLLFFGSFISLRLAFSNIN